MVDRSPNAPITTYTFASNQPNWISCTPTTGKAIDPALIMSTNNTSVSDLLLRFEAGSKIILHS
jgi:hypothetical protein